MPSKSRKRARVVMRIKLPGCFGLLRKRLKVVRLNLAEIGRQLHVRGVMRTEMPRPTRRTSMCCPPKVSYLMFLRERRDPHVVSKANLGRHAVWPWLFQSPHRQFSGLVSLKSVDVGPQSLGPGCLLACHFASPSRSFLPANRTSCSGSRYFIKGLCGRDSQDCVGPCGLDSADGDRLRHANTRLFLSLQFVLLHAGAGEHSVQKGACQEVIVTDQACTLTSCKACAHIDTKLQFASRCRSIE